MIDCLKERGDARNVYEEFLDTVLLYLYQALDYENHTKFQQNLKEAIEEGAAKMPTIAEHFIEKEGRKDCRKALKRGSSRESGKQFWKHWKSVSRKSQNEYGKKFMGQKILHTCAI